MEMSQSPQAPLTFTGNGRMFAAAAEGKMQKYMADLLWKGAGMLEDATSSIDFLRAVRHNAAVWKIIQRRATQYGWAPRLPTRGTLAERLFSDKRGLSDQDVSMIISINRHLSLRLMGAIKSE